MPPASARRLVLVRHAKSAYPAGVVDHDRPLNERGTRDAIEVGRWLESHLDFDAGAPPAVVVSSATRAQRTWQQARSVLSSRWARAEVRSEPRIYEASVPTLIDVISETSAEVSTLVIVGHNPGLADLIARLAPNAASEDDLLRLPTSAIAVLGAPTDWSTARIGVFQLEELAVPRALRG